MTSPRLLFSDKLRALGIPHAFTTRQGGASTGPFASLNLGRGVEDDPRTVAANLAAVLRALRLDPARHVEADQVHGSVVAVVGARDGGRSVPEADGLASMDGGTVLAVHAADCVPLLFADPRLGTVAAVHAGWKGVASGIPVEAVRVLGGRFGSRPQELVVAIGPSIGPCHYEVDKPVMDRMRRWPWWTDVAPVNAQGRWQLDLRAACVRQLIGAGVPRGRIDVLDLCTYDYPELFYSFRRDRITGRMAAIIAVPLTPTGGNG